MNISKGTGPKILAIAIYVAALAAAPTLLNGTLAQTESANTTSTTTAAATTTTAATTTAAAKGGSANSILISSSGKNYQCTSTGTATNPPTLGIHLSASKEGGTLKGQWHIIGTEFGEKKGTITGGTLDKTKYELKGRESIDTLCGGNVPMEVTISGNCGTNQRINFRIIDGSHGEFTGRAHCSELLF